MKIKVETILNFTSKSVNTAGILKSQFLKIMGLKCSSFDSLNWMF